MQHPSSVSPVLIVGGGVAGMQTALDLANLGSAVYLVEKDDHLGGQVMRLDKVYPTDHCAFCPTWTHARACREHPLITVATGMRFARLDETAGNKMAFLVRRSRPIAASDCVFCGTCIETCPKKAIIGHAKDLPLDPSSPPVPHIDESLCDACGACVKACPAQAIAFNREEEVIRLQVSDCIFAGGFLEPTPGESSVPAPEFGAYSHPDILTAMAFEKWSAEFNPDHTPVPLCPSDGRPVTCLAFIQCAGARDKRYLEQCSTVCCMHAAKQASWLKRRKPELDVIVFYTDLRAPGKGQEAYIQTAKSLGVRFYRRRPGLVAPVEGALGKGIMVRHETESGVGTTLADIVILNGGLACCPQPEPSVPFQSLPIEKRCGFCAEPADIAHSVIQAGNMAALTRLRERDGRDSTEPTTLAARGKNA